MIEDFKNIDLGNRFDIHRIYHLNVKLSYLLTKVSLGIYFKGCSS